MYHNIYIPSYTNFGSFLFGMIGGYLYCLHKQGHIDLVRTKVSGILYADTPALQRIQWRFLFQRLSIVWWCMIPIAFLALLSGFLFYDNEFEKPSLWIAIYSAFIKNMWGIFGATVITGIALNTGCKC